jgi:hypothetical protein
MTDRRSSIAIMPSGIDPGVLAQLVESSEDIVKHAVGINQKIPAFVSELHAGAEAVLIEHGGQQSAAVGTTSRSRPVHPLIL